MLFDKFSNGAVTFSNRVVMAPMTRCRAAYRGALIACGDFDRARGEAILARGHADLIAIGRPFIANPDLVARMRTDAPLTPWNEATFYTGGAKGFTDYPAL